MKNFTHDRSVYFIYTRPYYLKKSSRTNMKGKGLCYDPKYTGVIALLWSVLVVTVIRW